jgi:hypothetical protein
MNMRKSSLVFESAVFSGPFALLGITSAPTPARSAADPVHPPAQVGGAYVADRHSG